MWGWSFLPGNKHKKNRKQSQVAALDIMKRLHWILEKGPSLKGQTSPGTHCSGSGGITTLAMLKKVALMVYWWIWKC